MYEQSFATSEDIGDRRAMSAALNNLGVLLKDQGQLVEARRAHERSLAIRREIGDRSWTAVSLSNIGVVLFEEDRLREATTYYKESLAICREIGDKRGLVRALHNLAIVERETGQFAEARAGFEESLAARAAIGDKRGQVMGNVELGMVLLQQAEIRAARTRQEDAIRLADETRLKPGEAQARYQLGEIALAAGDLAESRRQHERALALRRDMKETRTILESQMALAAVSLEEGRAAEAEGEAQDVIRSLGQTISPLRAIGELVTARARLATQDIAGAAQALSTARALLKPTERVSLRSGLARVEAEVDAAAGRADQARQATGGARRRAPPIGHGARRARSPPPAAADRPGRWPRQRSSRCRRSGKGCEGAWRRADRQAPSSALTAEPAPSGSHSVRFMTHDVIRSSCCRSPIDVRTAKAPTSTQCQSRRRCRNACRPGISVESARASGLTTSHGPPATKPKIPSADPRPLPGVRTVVPFRTGAAASDLLP